MRLSRKRDSLLEGKLLGVPWRHHCYIITKCKSVKEALFYIDQTIANNWSRSALENAIDLNDYSARGKAVNNFKETLPLPQQNLAKEILKDPYNFDFLAQREKFDEAELEDALSKNIEKFLLELGKGFAYVGRQVELRVSDTSYFIDMLFYHIKLKCYVAVGLKVVDFKPEFVGKLNFYVNAVNNLLKGDDDKPTIGLLICKNKDNTKVEWSLTGVQTPIGVAEYKMPDFEDFKSSLPTIEELEEELRRIK